MDDKWIDSIKDKMAEYDFVPPDGLLESVQDEIRGRRIRRIRLWGVIAASVAVLIGIFAIMVSEKSDRYVPLIVNVADGDREKGSLNRQVEQTVSYASALSNISNATRRIGATEAVFAVNDPTPIPTLPSEPRQEEAQEYPESGKKTDTASGDSYPSSVTGNSGVNTDSKVRKVNGSSLSAGVSVSANGLGSLLNDNDAGESSIPTSASMPHTRMGGGMMSDSHVNAAPTPIFVERFDHKLPVRFSVDFSWPVCHNLHVGTGVTYSYLHSDISYGYSDSPLFNASQDLHFIGLPISVRYIPWSFRKLDIYTSTAFMAEKCIGGRINTDNPSDPGYSYTGCDDRPFQFSFNAAVGLQYSLAGRCAVFVEPGVGIYLKNGSRLRTIYSERPLTFSVNVGLRFGK
ncbi:MAG: hypothetical protein K2N48_14480 [Muribaculaceae bacterium]|nr:hypothetical protein [Muribaculaceae bacterium]